jgi:hypothetical protein
MSATWPLVVLGLVLAGCGVGEPASDEPADTPAETTPAETSPADAGLPEGADPAAQVSENYADCLSALGGTGEAVYAPGPGDGSQSVGQVVVTAPGLILVWDVGVGNTGDVLTFPADEETVAALESVGC